MIVENENRLAGNLLACPACAGPLRPSPGSTNAGWACAASTCSTRGVPFVRVNGKSVLVDFTTSVLDRDDTLASGGASVIRRGDWREKIAGIINGGNRVAPYFARSIVSELEEIGRREGRRPVILIVGGGSVGSGSDDLYTSPEVDVVAFDIYWSAQVTFIADAHAMPLTEGSVDAVWIQAVLEHVVDPIVVVEEIRRVLRPGGIVFADTPFMWPVHEKAWDYTRWTPSGHRWLFRHFDVLEAGASSGPGTLFVLSLRYLAASLFRSTKMGHLIALPFFWVRFLDNLCDARKGLDAAAGLFFYGRKSEKTLTPRGLIRFYDEQIALQDRTPSFRKAG